MIGDAPTLAASIRLDVTRSRPTPLKAAIAVLHAAAKAAGLGESFSSLIANHPDLEPFLATIVDASPFLRRLAIDDMPRLLRLLGQAPATSFDAVLLLVHDLRHSPDEAAIMAGLRRARAEIALLIALADLGGVFDVVEVTSRLSAFADAAVEAAAAFLLAEAARAGSIALADPADPCRHSGWILLGMGKLGAGELNYSSDIDLIVLFDPERATVRDPDEIARLFVRLTQRLIKLLSERTIDGYVFRTDLRLRPDPGSTQIAISTRAAFAYYEASGQNWERAAMIKARPIGGDLEAAQAFLDELAPFVWRKFLDYAAIADIHSIKRQIHDFRGHETVAVAGHNIKLGRGGIREIEFFVQTQQLIAGGRYPALRGRRTLDMLDLLARELWITVESAGDMAEAYRLLRRIEHRLQMVADEQTHTLPEDKGSLDIVARLSGYRTADAFGAALTHTLETVRDHYIRLFEAAPSLSSTLGSLVFTGDDEDPETVATLARLGYAHPGEVSRTIRGWHFGRYRAMRSATARERLTEITPALLQAFAATDNADAAFNAFDRLLARLPAGVPLFSLLASNPSLLNLLATIMGTAPRLAETVVSRTHVLDAVLDPAFFGRLPDRTVLAKRLSLALAESASLEEVLDRARIFGKEQAFLIGVRVITGTVGARAAGFAYADLAELLVATLFDRVRAEFETAHGRIAGGHIAILAMGKLGGREMTAASDLDLILLYDFDVASPSSDGPRSLIGGQYFARLAQRLIAALSAQTAQGTLYPVDFRLRPSGNAGPLATHIDAFRTYQAKEAWTWEHMALTRARLIAGDQPLIGEAAVEIGRLLSTPHDAKTVKADVLEMRSLLAVEKTAEGPWDLKQAPGGQIDIEFIAQFLQLIHGAATPEILNTETELVLAAAARLGLISAADAAILLPALSLLQRLVQLLRLCVSGPFRPEEAPRGLLDLLARAGELPDFATLDAHLVETERAVRAVFERLIGRVGKKGSVIRGQ